MIPLDHLAVYLSWVPGAVIFVKGYQKIERGSVLLAAVLVFTLMVVVTGLTLADDLGIARLIN